MLRLLCWVPVAHRFIYPFSSVSYHSHWKPYVIVSVLRRLGKPKSTLPYNTVKSSRAGAESFSAACSEMSEESCWLLGLWFMCWTFVSHRAWNLLQPWVSRQTTSPCVRTRWLCVLLTFLFNLILICWYVMAPNKVFWCCLTKMYAALLLLLQAGSYFLGTFQNEVYSDVTLKGCFMRSSSLYWEMQFWWFLHCLRLLSIPSKSPSSSFVINLSFYARETCMAGFCKSFYRNSNLARPSLRLNLLFSAFQLCWCMNSYILTVWPHHAHSRHSHEIQGC